MGTIHKAFMGELAKVPRLILLKLITEKLAEQGLGDHTGLADALADHCLKGDGDTFNWDDGAPSNDPTRGFAISFSEKDVLKLGELADKFMERLPAIIENTSKDAAERLLKTLKQRWPEQAAYERAVLEGFKERLEARWGKGFNLLPMLLIGCRELGEETATQLPRSRSNKKRILRSLLVRLHARACQITTEIVTLIENGFAD